MPATDRKRKRPAKPAGKKTVLDLFLAFLVLLLVLGILVLLLLTFFEPSIESVSVPSSLPSGQPSPIPATPPPDTVLPVDPVDSPSPQPTLDPSPVPVPSLRPVRTPGSSPPGPSRKPVHSPRASPLPSPLTVRYPGKPVLYLVLDDAGYSPEKTTRFLKLPVPMTLAVLPGLPESARVAAMVRRAGDEVILHQPMEALGEVVKAPGLITSRMTANQVKEILEQNIRSLGPITGINNHQGSRGTQDIALMRAIMPVLKSRNLIFLDSRTTAGTVADQASRESGVSFMKRDVFLDNIADENEIRKSIEKGLETARKQGYAVMIGHVWSDELYDVLLQDHLSIQAQGFSFEMLSAFLMYKNPARPPMEGETKRP